jgi:acetyl-CoA carboxylase carboxyltransferase component
MGKKERAGFDRAASKLPVLDPKEIYGIMPDSAVKPYDMHEIIKRIVDDSEFTPYKDDYGKTII